MARKNSAECWPSHSKEEPQAAVVFKEELNDKLQDIETETRVKIWMMDRAHFGLHTELRRVRTLRGNRPVVPRQIKCLWDYLYEALSVTGGDVHFSQLSKSRRGFRVSRWSLCLDRLLSSRDSSKIWTVSLWGENRGKNACPMPPRLGVFHPETVSEGCCRPNKMRQIVLPKPTSIWSNVKLAKVFGVERAIDCDAKIPGRNCI